MLFCVQAEKFHDCPTAAVIMVLPSNFGKSAHLDSSSCQAPYLIIITKCEYKKGVKTCEYQINVKTWALTNDPTHEQPPMR